MVHIRLPTLHFVIFGIYLNCSKILITSLFWLPFSFLDSLKIPLKMIKRIVYNILMHRLVATATALSIRSRTQFYIISPKWAAHSLVPPYCSLLQWLLSCSLDLLERANAYIDIRWCYISLFKRMKIKQFLIYFFERHLFNSDISSRKI